jgi:antitoxin component of MazEF toxin-antitoxin module
MQNYSVQLIKVGNSKGIILPKKAIEQLGMDKNGVQMEISDEAIIITPAHKNVRKGWAKAFKKMKAAGDDKLVFPDIFKDEKLTDWKW